MEHYGQLSWRIYADAFGGEALNPNARYHAYTGEATDAYLGSTHVRTALDHFRTDPKVPSHVPLNALSGERVV